MRKLTVEDLNRIDVDTFRRAEKLPLIMVLDNVRSLHNVGSVLRTADAFRIEAVYMCGITATPPPSKSTKRHSELKIPSVGATLPILLKPCANSKPMATWCSLWNRWKAVLN